MHARRPTGQASVTPIAVDLQDAGATAAALQGIDPDAVFITTWLRQDSEAENTHQRGDGAPSARRVAEGDPAAPRRAEADLTCLASPWHTDADLEAIGTPSRRYAARRWTLRLGRAHPHYRKTRRGPKPSDLRPQPVEISALRGKHPNRPHYTIARRRMLRDVQHLPSLPCCADPAPCQTA